LESNTEIPTTQESADAQSAIRIEPGLKQTAVTSTLSFVFGIGALLSLVLVYPAMILALPAIGFGHIAKVTLRNAKGELVGWGKARMGKLLGYFCLVVSVVLFLNLEDYRLLLRGAINSERTAVARLSDEFSEGPLGEIERKLAAGATTEFGNNETAEKLAAAFRQDLRQSLNSVLTHRDNKGLGLDTSGISCYCHVDEAIWFIAALPELSQYNGAAEDVMRKSAWQAAVLAIDGNVLGNIANEGDASEGATGGEDANEGGATEGDANNGADNKGNSAERKLSVGLMEAKHCESVLVGTFSSEANGAPAPDRIELNGSQIAELLKVE